jgi:hypothetical protein
LALSFLWKIKLTATVLNLTIVHVLLRRLKYTQTICRQLDSKRVNIFSIKSVLYVVFIKEVENQVDKFDSFVQPDVLLVSNFQSTYQIVVGLRVGVWAVPTICFCCISLPMFLS